MAKRFLKEGAYDSNVKLSDVKGSVLDESTIVCVEHMYRIDDSQAYYEPYYCFYVKLEEENSYGRFYVQATMVMKEDEMLMPESDTSAQQKFKILDMRVKIIWCI
ncbi:MAG: hypothetical protein IJ455_05930 [Agathobacter sp.]|nr:hypothetical protein [Agathobacter sp.]